MSPHLQTTTDQSASEVTQPEATTLEKPVAHTAAPEPAATAASAIDKKKQRAERFGVPVALSDAEKLKLRAERCDRLSPSGSHSAVCALIAAESPAETCKCLIGLVF